MKYELLIFDWDGTLMDSAGHIVASLQGAARDMDLPVPPPERASYVIGLGLTQALEYLFPMLPEADHPRLADCYRNHYLGQDHTIPLFAGADSMLRRLHARGHVLAVATGKSRRGLERAMQHTALEPIFTATRTADQTFSKPHPAMIEEIIAEVGGRPETTLMIGDTSHDLQMAVNAGVAGLGVSYGAHEMDLLQACNPLAIVDTMVALANWLDENG